ncbi:MAG: cytochrome c oxidase subunit II [Inquilinus sp.]|nr:cytochrome c oxidase subunit II [Inquilinus sp.]
MRVTRLASVAGLLLLAVPGVALAAGGPQDWAMNLREPASPVMEQLTSFHNLLLWITGGIVALVTVLLLVVIVKFNAKANPTPSRNAHNTLIEVVWTVVPVIILVVIAIPSFRLLYFMDRVEEPEMTLVVRGYQWYWGYEYPDQQIEEYSSFLVEDENLQPDQLRLLSVDNPIVLPVDTDIEILVTAGDVLHSFAIPNLGLKTDAVPGQTNHTWTRITEPGTYYGMCSELCGTGHGYMPIEIRAVSRAAFDDWVEQQVAGRELAEPPVLLTRDYDPASAGDASRIARAGQ